PMADVELLPLPAITRYTVCGDIAYPIYEDADGSFVDYDDHVAAMHAYARANMKPLIAENERLKEALEMMVEMVEMNGFGKAAAMDTARAALAQEDRND